MSKKNVPTYAVVVDASVARAAGSLESVRPRGALCRDFLLALRSVCHRITWTPAIKAEWDKHESLFASQWRVSMFSLRKLRTLGEALSSAVQDSIREHCHNKDILSIVLADCHLIEAAAATDFRIASLDDQARGHFADLARVVECLRDIIWVNPAIARERAVEWLRKGAPDGKSRRLSKSR
jgi:hypothetical protein